LDDKTRQKLKPLIPFLINTRADRDTRLLRARFITHRMLTVTFPIFTDALGLAEISARLRETKNETQSFHGISAYLRDKQQVIKKVAYADADAATAAYAAGAAAYAAGAAAAAADAAADAAYAAADAADAQPAKKAKWKAVKDDINESAIETLRLACAIRLEKP
jgi:hypothetical protein